VRELVELAFAQIGVSIEWRGKGVDETGIDAATGAVRVAVDPRYFRPTEVDLLIGDPSKAHNRLGWRHEIGFEALVAEMVAADLIAVGQEARRRGE
jgi:GDPmannose 4,6-dehydratase